MNKRIRTGLLAAAMVGGGLVGATQLAGNASAQNDAPAATQSTGDATVQALVQSFHNGDSVTDDTTQPPFGNGDQGPGQGDCDGAGGARGPGGPGGQGARGGQGLDTAAETIGIEQSELREGLQSDLTIAQISELNGVPTQTVIDAMVADMSEHLDEKVAAGELTEAEAADRLEEGVERITSHVTEGRPDRPGRPAGTTEEGS